MLKKLIACRTKSTTETSDVLDLNNHNASGGYPPEQFVEKFGNKGIIAVVYHYADGKTFLHYPCK